VKFILSKQVEHFRETSADGRYKWSEIFKQKVYRGIKYYLLK